MRWTEGESYRGDRLLGAAHEFIVLCIGEPRGSHVDCLFEKGSIERVRFIEDSQDAKFSVRDQSFDGELTPRDKALHLDPSSSLFAQDLHEETAGWIQVE